MSVLARGRDECYPDFTAELVQLRREGVSAALVRKVIEKHRPRAAFDRGLYERYRGCEVPIFNRRARFLQEEGAINNRLNSDFYGEIVDFKTGYFAGRPVGYSYAGGTEARRETAQGAAGGEAAVAAARKALTDFVARSNMFDVDMEVTKLAAACGYAARLFYIDRAGNERVMPIAPFEAAILSDTDMTEPVAALRYFLRMNEENKEEWVCEFYDGQAMTLFCGERLEALEAQGEPRPHMFAGCPLQGVPNNSEMTADGEKQLALMDAYDRALSDANNESESFANAYMVYENVNIDEEQMKLGQRSGAIRFYNGAGAPGRIYFVTKDVNDSFCEHHLDRLEENIYRFSKTPRLSDEHFAGNASGVALRFKLTGLEAKCGMFEAKMRSAGGYMFELLCGCWRKKGVLADPLQCVMDFHRNFPLELLEEAQGVKTLQEAGVPKSVALAQLPFVDDVEYVLQQAEQEKTGLGGAHKKSGIDKES